jgi:hypothetical protein
MPSSGFLLSIIFFPNRVPAPHQVRAACVRMMPQRFGGSRPGAMEPAGASYVRGMDEFLILDPKEKLPWLS